MTNPVPAFATFVFSDCTVHIRPLDENGTVASMIAARQAEILMETECGGRA